MTEDPFFAVTARRELLRAEAEHRRRAALVQPPHASLRARLAERMPRLRPAPATCATC